MLKTGKNCACKWCNKQFYVPLWKLKDGKGNYCSQSCYFSFKKSKVIEATCHTCNKDFTTFQYRLDKGKHTYCSKECANKRKNEHRKGLNQTIFNCDYCAKEFPAYPKQRRGKHTFCSKQCADSFRVGQKSPSTRKRLLGKRGDKAKNWRGGRINSNGYIKIFAPHHPHRTKGGYVREHILVAKKALGRLLNEKEVIHHLNEITDDNRPENLYLFATTGEHTTYHKTKNSPKLVSNLV